jgi:hypothetical protein
MSDTMPRESELLSVIDRVRNGADRPGDIARLLDAASTLARIRDAEARRKRRYRERHGRRAERARYAA